MSIREDLEEVEKKIHTIEHESFAMEMLKDQRKQNKRLFIIILVILGMWLLTIGAFMYYILTVDYEEDYREQLVENITENEELKIINGDSYGDSKAN